MSGLSWCCCSAGRPELLVRKTLATLARGNFQGSLYVVVPSEELVVYTQALKDAPVHCILMHCAKGLTNQRRFFREQMLPDTEIVFIDDDVEAIKLLTPTGLVHCHNVDFLANYVFQAMKYRGDDCLLAGVYPMCNRDFQTRTIVDGHAYIVGALYFIRNREEVVDPPGDECEDHYRQLHELASGRPTLRFNFIGIQTQYWKNPGGLQTERSVAKRVAAIDDLCQKFPGLVKRCVRRNEKVDIRYIKRPTRWEAAPVPASDLAAPEPSPDLSTASADPPVLSSLTDLSGQAQ